MESVKVKGGKKGLPGAGGPDGETVEEVPNLSVIYNGLGDQTRNFRTYNRTQVLVVQESHLPHFHLLRLTKSNQDASLRRKRLNTHPARRRRVESKNISCLIASYHFFPPFHPYGGQTSQPARLRLQYSILVVMIQALYHPPTFRPARYSGKQST